MGWKREPTEWEQFLDWKHELIEELEKVGDPGLVPINLPFVDAMIPFHMGLSPARTASALLGHDSKTMARILDIQFKDPDCVAYRRRKLAMNRAIAQYYATEEHRWEDDGGRVAS
jgi:hypothetical protein